MGAPMHALRSRVGVVSITAGAAVLLALPVVAAGQVPVVDQVVGGVQQTAESIAPVPELPALPVLPAPPAPVQAPAPAPKPAPAAPAPAAAAPAPAASAPAPQRQSTPSSGAQSSSSAGKASARSAAKRGSAAKERSSVSARSAADTPARASQDEPAEQSASADVASQAVELPADASPETLPFTGLQLALMGMAGLVALAGGLVLRRSARTARR